MFLFGFKSTLNLASSNKNKEPEIISGVYRLNRGEFVENGNISDSPKKISPSMVKLPETKTTPSKLLPSKSTNDLVQSKNTQAYDVNLRKSTPNVSNDPRGGTSNMDPRQQPTTNQSPKVLDKNQKKLEKQQENERKKRDKLAEQERKKQQKLKKEREKQLAKQMERERKEKIKADKKKPPLPKSQPPSAQPQPAQRVTSVNPLAKTNTAQPTAFQPSTAQPVVSTSRVGGQYSTNTLDSSISKTSGPPPYSEIPKSTETVASINDTSANVSFGKPLESDSWDMISQHRQQMNRPTTVIGSSKSRQTVMDLQYRGNVPTAKTSVQDSDA